jgi:RND family efflux transporter MFP subunit
VGLTPDDSEEQLNPENSPPVLVERAALEESQKAYVRAERLRQRQVVTEAEFEQIQAQLKSAQARYRSAVNDVHEQIAVIGQRRADLALAEQQLTDATIVAPFDGILQQRQVSPGQSVQVGQALVTLVRVSKLRFTAGVPESAAHLIRQGQTLQIRLAGEAEPVIAQISRVSPAVTLTSRALWIEADVVNPALRWQAGLFAEADIIVDSSAQALTIPSAAIRDFAGVQKVWVVKDGAASEHTVRVGRRDGDRVEVVDGLAAGDEIVSKSAAGKAGPVIAMRSEKPSGTEPTGLTE